MAKSLPAEEAPFDLPGDRLDDRLAQGVDGLPRSGLELNLQARAGRRWRPTSAAVAARAFGSGCMVALASRI